MSALDDLFDAGFETVAISRYGDETRGEFRWTASCLRRHNGLPPHGSVATPDGLGWVSRSSTHLHLTHYGATREAALDGLAALAGVAELILAGATEGSATRGADG